MVEKWFGLLEACKAARFHSVAVSMDTPVDEVYSGGLTASQWLTFLPADDDWGFYTCRQIAARLQALPDRSVFNTLAESARPQGLDINRTLANCMARMIRKNAVLMFRGPHKNGIRTWGRHVPEDAPTKRRRLSSDSPLSQAAEPAPASPALCARVPHPDLSPALQNVLWKLIHALRKSCAHGAIPRCMVSCMHCILDRIDILGRLRQRVRTNDDEWKQLMLGYGDWECAFAPSMWFFDFLKAVSIAEEYLYTGQVNPDGLLNLVYLLDSLSRRKK